MTGVRLHHSNRLEVLAAELAQLMRTDPGDPFAPERIVVPHPTIRRWLSLELARELGIAANLCFEQPAEFAWSIMRGVVPGLSSEQPYQPARLRWRIHDLLPGPAGETGRPTAEGGPAGVPPRASEAGGADRVLAGAVGGYLRDGDPRKRLALADRLARMYDQCLLYRPDWIREWENGSAPHWQARLWQLVVGPDDPNDPDGPHHWVNALDRFRRGLRDGYPASSADAASLADAASPADAASLADPASLADNRSTARSSESPRRGQTSDQSPLLHAFAPLPPAGDSPRPSGWPRRASFFAMPALSPSYLELLCDAARGIEIHLFLLNPCREYWGDIYSRREIDHRAEGVDPDSGYFTEGNELLAAWGRAGRDMFDALVDVAGATSEEHFVASPGAGRLAAVQRDILDLRLANEAARDDAVLAGALGENGLDAGAPLGSLAEAARMAMPWHAQTDRSQGDGRPLQEAAREARPRHAQAPPADDSIQIHVCHSPVREAEVLHDRLLAIFDAHPNLEPADVLVLTPDLEIYGPAIEAVFAAAGRIPCNVARARAVESRTLRAFLDLLSLPGSRHGAEPVLAPLAAPAIRSRFGIGEPDITTIRGWVRDAGIRWGVDEAHRGEEDLPETADHTWRHGLRRLLLGYAMADAGDPVAGLVPCRPGEGGFEGAEVNGELLGRFVSFCAQVFELRARLGGRRPPVAWGAVLRGVVRDFLADGSEWAPGGGGAGRLDSWALIRELADEVAVVRTLIRDFESEAAHAESPVPLEVVLEVLHERAHETKREAARLADGVTVASLGAGRIFPAGVVCVAGMNDGGFPRSPSAPSFDLVAAGGARRGDRDIRHEDRFAFLEALLAARRCFLVTYAGRGLRDDAPIPPSVLVDELKDYLGRRFPGEAIETRHPLQPFSPRYFEAPVPHMRGVAPAVAAAVPLDPTSRGAQRDPEGESEGRTGARAEDRTETEIEGRVPGREAEGKATATRFASAGEPGFGEDLFSYSRGMCDAAKTMRAGSATSESPSRFAGVTLPEPDESRRCVDLAELVAFFANPTRFFLRERLGVRLELDDLALEDEEPFELDALEHYHLRSDIWGQMETGIEPERGAVLLHGSGRLPQAGLGRIVHELAREEVEPLEDLLAPYRRALQSPPRPIDFELGEFRVVGGMENIEHVELGDKGPGGAETCGSEAGATEFDRMVWWRIGRLRARDRIEVWLRQLAWTAAGHGPLEAVAVWLDRGSWKSATFPPPDDACEQLGHWLGAWWLGLAEPLHVFPETSMAFADAMARAPKGGDAVLETAREKSRVAWFGDQFRRGERLDPYLALVHDAKEPLTGSFEDLASKLLVPLARAQP